MDEREKIYRKVLFDLGKYKKAGGVDCTNYADAAWTLVRSEDDCTWVNDLANERNKDNYDHDTPCGDLSDLVNEFLDAGISPKALARYTKLIQYELLFGFSYMLNDPYNELIAADIEMSESWGLFQRKENDIDAITGDIRAGHVPLLGGDPSQREMEPEKEADYLELKK